MREKVEEKISDALEAFHGEALGDAALGLVEALGYHSPYGGQEYSAEGFLKHYFPDLTKDEKKRLKMRERLVDRVRTIHAVSQIGKGELNKKNDDLNGRGEENKSEINVEDGKTFLFLTVEVKEDLTLTRAQYAETTRLLNRHLPMPLIIIYRTGEEINIAFAQRQEREGGPDLLGTVSLLRNISCKEPHRGHISILRDLSLDELRKRVNNFDTLLEEWLEILSAKTLNRNFYQELSEWFTRAVKESKFPLSKNSNEKPEVIQQRHVIRLITRILFIWFIKEKGLVAEELFNEIEVKKLLKDYDAKEKDTYYRAILQNLFFATLNTEMEERRFSRKIKADHRNFNLFRYAKLIADKNRLISLFEKTPFVNGGLFDCLDDFKGMKEGGKRMDCFTDQPNQQKDRWEGINVPNALFFDKKGLFPILNRYKFTVEERTPVDQEVALDPELLGRVFENLLATLNPETGEQARKSTGSFYTPRAVVDYMVREALVAYFLGKMLTDKNSDLEKRLRHLLTANVNYENLKKSDRLTTKETKIFVERTRKLRLLDPAVGSGAFPMGALAQITMALERIDPENKILKEQEMRHAEESDVKFGEESKKVVERVFSEENNFNNYGRKLSLIRDCLFGVDIQPEAVQIARLRFFISLAIEQEVDDNKENRGIEPLPNLEARLLAANTLKKIGVEKMKSRNIFMGNPEIKQYIENLKIIRNNFFSANSRDKKRDCEKQDEKKRQELADYLEKKGFPENDAYEIAWWNPYNQIDAASWFDPKWMLGVSEGFDIVIGNPPYKQVGKGIHSKLNFPYSEGQDKGKQNLYKLFVEESYNLCKEGGVATMIVQGSLMADLSSAATRKLLLTSTILQHIIEFPESARERENQVFESVTQGTCIYQFTKAQSDDYYFGISVGNDSKTIANPKLIRISKKDIFSLYPNLLSIPKLRSPIEINVLRRVASSFHIKPLEHFIVSLRQGDINLTMQKLFFSEQKSSAKLLRGRHVKRYCLCYSEAEQYIKPEYMGSVEKKIAANKKNVYLISQEIMSQTAPRRLHIALHDTQNPIIYGHSVNKTLLRNQQQCDFFIGLMNSKFMDWYYRLTSSNNSVLGYELEQLPIPEISREKQIPVAQKANKILAIKSKNPNADTTELEKEIDQLVYRLYSLTSGEIKAIESSK